MVQARYNRYPIEKLNTSLIQKWALSDGPEFQPIPETVLKVFQAGLRLKLGLNY